MGKIATEQEAYGIGGKGTPVANKCCTRSRAIALGCKVSGNYSLLQLVQLSDLSKSGYTLRIKNNTNYSGDITIYAKESLSSSLIAQVPASITAYAESSVNTSIQYGAVTKVDDGMIDGVEFNYSFDMLEYTLTLISKK